LGERWNLFELYHEWLLIPKDKRVTDEHFWVASQLYGVLYPMMILSQQVQTDTFGAIAYTYYFIMRVLCMYHSKNKYWVVDTKTTENVDKETRWGGPLDLVKDRLPVQSGGARRPGRH
jgi:hypothetical protein